MSATPEYAELHCHSSYSLLDGASQPEELVAQASALGLRALALTDHDGLYSAPTFCRLAETFGLQPVVGAELTLAQQDSLKRLESTWDSGPRFYTMLGDALLLARLAPAPVAVAAQ